jgi:TPR repeat protein
MYEFGYGVPVNKEEARHYYGLAAAQGGDNAQKRPEEIAKQAWAFFPFRRKR